MISSSHLLGVLPILAYKTAPKFYFGEIKLQGYYVLACVKIAIIVSFSLTIHKVLYFFYVLYPIIQ